MSPEQNSGMLRRSTLKEGGCGFPVPPSLSYIDSGIFLSLRNP